MRISNCVKNDDDSYDFDFHVDSNEAGFLMDFAIKSLVHYGLLNIETDKAEYDLKEHMEAGGSIQ
jgi:hypothetical protein